MFGRGILGIPELMRTWTCDSNHIVVKLMGTGLMLQSMFFISQMFSILKSRANEYAERKAKNIKMKWFVALTSTEVSQINAYNKKSR